MSRQVSKLNILVLFTGLLLHVGLSGPGNMFATWFFLKIQKGYTFLDDSEGYFCPHLYWCCEYFDQHLGDPPVDPSCLKRPSCCPPSTWPTKMDDSFYQTAPKAFFRLRDPMAWLVKFQSRGKKTANGSPWKSPKGKKNIKIRLVDTRSKKIFFFFSFFVDPDWRDEVFEFKRK